MISYSSNITRFASGYSHSNIYLLVCVCVCVCVES